MIFAVVLVGARLPISPLAAPLGFVPLPAQWYTVVILLVLAYLALVDVAKGYFLAHVRQARPHWVRGRTRRLHRRASRFSAPSAQATARVPSIRRLA